MSISEQLALLRSENEMLKALLLQHGIALSKNFHQPKPTNIPQSRSNHLSSEEKVKLFRQLFRGRDDVYPVRWESKSSVKSGYSPVCNNEWRSGICQKPRIKCNECAHSLYATVTDQVITRHLTGEIIAGIYPLLADDRCYFLALDFDDAEWREDAKAVFQTCVSNHLSAALEISRSGEGAHLWLFFSEATLARDARKLGAALISETCKRIRQLQLSSYDRMFPNQDTLPKGGFGNLIALPLQKASRRLGRSVFVDSDLQPVADQWLFLQSIKPLTAQDLDTALTNLVGDQHPLDIVSTEIHEENEDAPWIQAPKFNQKLIGIIPKQICATLANQLFIEKFNLPQALLNRLIRIAAFQNPEFYKAQAMRLSTWNLPRIIGCAENYPKHIALPRGCLDDVISLLSTNQIDLKLSYKYGMGQPLQATFNGELRGDQQKALNAIFTHQFGMLAAPTAFGKTVVAAALIARRQVSTLILVHRKELMLQWQERLTSFLTLETGKIGIVGSGKNNPTGLLDVGIIQSLTRRDDLAEFLNQYGQIIVDEAHHLSAQSFESVLKSANVQYVLGLSATPMRSDGHHPIIFMQCGPIRHRAKRPLHIPQKLTVRVQYLSAPLTPPDASIQDTIQALATDHARNMHIVEDAITALKMGRKVLLLTKRTDHLHLLNDYLQNLDYPIFILHGKMKAKDRQTVLDSLKLLPTEAPHLLLASAQLVGEGFDHAPLDTLIIALPISWQGTLQQYVGRLHREHIGKTDVLVHDYAELDHPQLSRMWGKRQRGYKAMGYQIDDQNQGQHQERIALFAE